MLPIGYWGTIAFISLKRWTAVLHSPSLAALKNLESENTYINLMNTTFNFKLFNQCTSTFYIRSYNYFPWNLLHDEWPKRRFLSISLFLDVNYLVKKLQTLKFHRNIFRTNHSAHSVWHWSWQIMQCLTHIFIHNGKTILPRPN